MPSFPISEPEITRLAQDISRGLTANPELFPAPPATAAEIDQALGAYNVARDAAITASSAALQGTAAKDEALNALVGMMRADLKYAEANTRNGESKLQRLGWVSKRRRLPTDVPGQVITLQLVHEGKTSVRLLWKDPFDGGKVAAYKVQRRQRDEGDWQDHSTSVKSGTTLT